MSITSSYNKHTGKNYAYETTYVWDETQQKKVQKKRCIGQYDPDTGEIIPNGKRGRPRKETVSIKPVTAPVHDNDNASNDALVSAITDLSARLKNMEAECSAMAGELHGLNNEISGLMKEIRKR